MVSISRIKRNEAYVGATVKRGFFRDSISPQKGGVLIFEGDAGQKAGFKMTGGTLMIKGNCGDFAGHEMGGGNIIVSGNSRNHTGNKMYAGCIVIGGTAECVGHKKENWVGEGTCVIIASKINVKSFTPKGMWVITNRMRDNWWDHVAEFFGRKEDNLIVIEKGKLDVSRLIGDFFENTSSGDPENQINNRLQKIKEEVFSALKASEPAALGQFMMVQSKKDPDLKLKLLSEIHLLFFGRSFKGGTLSTKIKNVVQRVA